MEKQLPSPLDLVKSDIHRFVADMLLAATRKPVQEVIAPPVSAAPVVANNKPAEVSKDAALEFVSSKNSPVEKKQATKTDFFAALPVEIMSEFEKKQAVIATHFSKSLATIFVNVLTPPTKLHKKTSNDSLDDLQLIDEETLMFRLVLDNFSSKVNDEFKIGIALCCLRFEKVLGFEIDLMLSPLSPYSIGNALERALSIVEMDAKNKKQLLMATLKTMIVEYPRLLKAVNDIFLKKGVLPKLTDADAKARIEKYLRKMQAQEEGEDDEELDNGDGDGDGPSAFARDFFKEIAIPQESEHFVVSNPNGVLIPQAQLLSNISSMQAVLVNTDAQTGYMQPVPTQSTFSELLAANSDIGEYALTAEHSKTIGIISMLFDTLRNEEGISGPMKALLLQLTVPLLKAAVQDDEFFSDKSNPAQVLFNSIAEASSSWTAESSANNDFLYKKMSSIVQKVTEDYEHDGDVFEDAVDDFSTFVDKEKQKTQRIEERIVAAETAQARIQAARKFAQKRIFDVFGDFILDESLKYFIDKIWEQALFYVANNHMDNKDASEWQQIQSIENKLAKILDYLAISCSLDDLFIEIARFLKVAGHSESDTRIELEKIREDLSALIEDAEEDANPEQPSAKVSVSIMEMVENIGVRPSVEISGPDEISKPVPVEKTTALKDSDDIDDDEFEIDTVDVETVLDIDPAIDDYEKNYQAAQEAEMQAMLSKVAIGCWIEDKESDPPSKVKLAAHIKYTDTYVFVNRKGVKAVSYDGPTLALRLHDKLMVIVDNSQLYDRSIENIIGNLRSESSHAAHG